MDLVINLHEQIDYDAHKTCSVKYPTATDCIECCSKPYFEKINIDYSCAQKRKIYVARYCPAYLSEVYKALSLTPQTYVRQLFGKREIRVASIGGGPGTDIAAFKKWLSDFLDQDDKVEKIQFLRVDIHEEWDDISRAMIKLYESSDIEFEYRKAVRDITKPLSFNNFGDFDVIMMSYVMSEIGADDLKNVAESIRSAFSGTALVVINDRPQDEVITNINQLIEELGGISIRIQNPTDRDHCGESYPEEIFDKVKATVFRKSIRWNFLIQ